VAKAPTVRELAATIETLKLSQKLMQEYLDADGKARSEITQTLVGRIIDVERRNKELDVIIVALNKQHNENIMAMNGVKMDLENYRRVMVEAVKDIDKLKNKQKFSAEKSKSKRK